MQMLRYFILCFILTAISACVGTKTYRAELSAREQCEAREKVLVQEALERRKETAKLVEQIGSLNRTLGSQDAELRELKLELTSRTQQMGESSTKLLSEKTNLEKELSDNKTLLAQREATIQSIAAAQRSRQNILNELNNMLAKNYPESAGYLLETNSEAILLTLPDALLFDKNGLDLSAGGIKALTPLASLLSSRPELDVDILAYTDNQLPKGAKGIGDTWDWSLNRAIALVRTLIREYNVNANQLTPVGKGEFYPVTSNESAAGRQKNRRTVIAIYPSLPVVPKL